MKNNFKRNIIMIITVILTILMGSTVLGIGESIDINLEEGAAAHSQVISDAVDSDNSDEKLELDVAPVTKDEPKKIEDTNGVDLNDASEDVINAPLKKADRKAQLIDKYNDKVFGTVAYYLEILQKYSYPICFIGITIGAFNFLIIGNKKLDKKEQGFGWIVGFTIGLVVFNVIPLLFALIVAGR